MLRFSICPNYLNAPLARSRVSKKKVNLLPLCGFIHSYQMLICSGLYSNSSQSCNHEESLGNESLRVCFAFCIRKGKIHNFNFVLSIPTSKHPLAPSSLYQDWRRWNSDVDNSYFPPETCTTTIMCAWLSRSARELSHVHSQQKGPRIGNRRTCKTILVAIESKELTAVEFEPGTPGSEITELPTKACWRVQVIEKAICLWFLFFIRTENQDASSVCSRRVSKKFVLEKF